MTEGASPPPGKKSTVAERLRWARERAKFSSPRNAATALGWEVEAYRKYESGERGKNGLKPDRAEKYAKGFGVNETWLATGKGAPFKIDLELTEEEAALIRALRSTRS